MENNTGEGDGKVKDGLDRNGESGVV